MYIRYGNPLPSMLEGKILNAYIRATHLRCPFHSLHFNTSSLALEKLSMERGC